eukprot:3735351-Rhodomonas_salina.1
MRSWCKRTSPTRTWRCTTAAYALPLTPVSCTHSSFLTLRRHAQYMAYKRSGASGEGDKVETNFFNRPYVNAHMAHLGGLAAKLA